MTMNDPNIYPAASNMSRFNADPSTAAETYAVIGWLFACTTDVDVPRTEPPAGLVVVAELGQTELGWRFDAALRNAWSECSPELREWLTLHLFPLADDRLRQTLLGTRRTRTLP